MTMYDDNNNRPRPVRNDGMGWGLPAALVAGVLIIGGLIYMNSDNRTNTAANNNAPTTSTTTTAPTGSPAPARTPTTTPAPAPKQ